MNHLSESQLQGLAEQPGARSPEIARHLRACPECRRRLSAYSALMADLGQLPRFGLAPRQIEQVMLRLPSRSRQVFPAILGQPEIWLSAFLAAGCLAVLIFLFPLPALLLPMFSAVESFFALLRRMIALLADLYRAQLFVLSSLAALLAGAILDQAIRRLLAALSNRLYFGA